MKLHEYVIVGIVAFVAVWLINRGLTMAGLSQYKA